MISTLVSEEKLRRVQQKTAAAVAQRIKETFNL